MCVSELSALIRVRSTEFPLLCLLIIFIQWLGAKNVLGHGLIEKSNKPKPVSLLK